MKKRKVLYPGSFDPITYGHIDVIERALHLFDEVIVGIAVNREKKPTFTIEERIDFIRRAFPDNERVKACYFDGLAVDFAKKEEVSCLIRGLRATSDFEYEFQIALTNRKLAPKLETIFLTPQQEYFYISSRVLKEVAAFSGSLDGLAPDYVAQALKNKISALKK